MTSTDNPFIAGKEKIIEQVRAMGYNQPIEIEYWEEQVYFPFPYTNRLYVVKSQGFRFAISAQLAEKSPTTAAQEIIQFIEREPFEG